MPYTVEEPSYIGSRALEHNVYRYLYLVTHILYYRYVITITIIIIKKELEDVGRSITHYIIIYYNNYGDGNNFLHKNRKNGTLYKFIFFFYIKVLHVDI